MQVVDGKQQRLARREVSGEPEEPVQRRERVFRQDLRVAQPSFVEERRGERGGAREQLLALLSRGEREHGLEELANDTERELVLPLAAARGQYPHPRGGRERARLADEPRLPDAGVALDRDEATVAPARNLDHRAQRRELRLALEQDEAAGCDARACARRELREHVGQPGHDELVEPLRAVETLEPVLAEVAERHLAREVVLHEPCCRRGQEDLATVAGVADPRGLVDGEADVSVFAERRLARVDAHAHADDRPPGPLLASERLLAGDRALDGRARAAEDREEGVALPVDLGAARVLEGLPEELVVDREDATVVGTPEVLQELGRALDVGEEERDRAGGKRAHARTKTRDETGG